MVLNSFKEITIKRLTHPKEGGAVPCRVSPAMAGTQSIGVQGTFSLRGVLANAFCPRGNQRACPWIPPSHRPQAHLGHADIQAIELIIQAWRRLPGPPCRRPFNAMEGKWGMTDCIGANTIRSPVRTLLSLAGRSRRCHASPLPLDAV